MTTPLQQAIFEELEKYTSIENMRENAQAIADKVASKPDIQTCSKTYVLRMIKRREDRSETPSFKVEPPEPESEEDEESEFDEDEDIPAQDEWDFEEEDEEEHESESESEEESVDYSKMPIDKIINEKAAKTLVEVPFRMAADWTGYEGFKLTPEETRQLVPVVRPLLIKYVPDILGKYLPEILCAFVVLSILGPKVKGYREFQEEKRAKQLAEKEAKERAKQLAERERLAALSTPVPVPEETPKPRTKEEAGQPSWNDPRRQIG